MKQSHHKMQTDSAMQSWLNCSLQTSFWHLVSKLRNEAQMCDIILYVPGKHGRMVGYPAHRLVLINASKYFKTLLKKEPSLTCCHLPNLTEDSLSCLLDLMYGEDMPADADVDEVLHAVNELQVDSISELLKRKATENATMSNEEENVENPQHELNDSVSETISSSQPVVKPHRKRKSNTSVMTSKKDKVKKTVDRSLPPQSPEKAKSPNNKNVVFEEEAVSQESVARFVENSTEPLLVIKQEPEDSETPTQITIVDMSNMTSLTQGHQHAIITEAPMPCGKESDNMQASNTDEPHTSSSLDGTSVLLPATIPTAVAMITAEDNEESAKKRNGKQLIGEKSNDDGDANEQTVHKQQVTSSHGNSPTTQSDHADGTSKSSQQPHSTSNSSVHVASNQSSTKQSGSNFSRVTAVLRSQSLRTPKLYTCPVCLKDFPSNAGLAQHKRLHSGEKPFKCEICSQSFTQLGHLIRHKRKHTGERPFRCQQCGAAFSQDGSLKQHLLLHSGDKPYECQHCGRQFTQIGNMRRHQIVHKQKQVYRCDECPRVYKHLSKFNMHLLQHEKGDVEDAFASHSSESQ